MVRTELKYYQNFSDAWITKLSHPWCSAAHTLLVWKLLPKCAVSMTICNNYLWVQINSWHASTRMQRLRHWFICVFEAINKFIALLSSILEDKCKKFSNRSCDECVKQDGGKVVFNKQIYEMNNHSTQIYWIPQILLSVPSNQGWYSGAWQLLPPSNVSRVQILASTSFVGWVCCWFSPFFWEVLLCVLWFSRLLKAKFQFNQECMHMFKQVLKNSSVRPRG